MSPTSPLLPEEAAATYTVDEALAAAGSGKFQAMAFAYAGMGWLSESMEVMLLSFVGPAVQSLWRLSPRQESLLTSFVFAGELLGAAAWGLVADRHGRRKGFLFTVTVTSVAGILSSLAPNYATLLAARFFVGVGLGGGPVFSSWFLEFVPTSNRGIWMIAFSIFWTAGTILEASLAWAVMPTLGWRWLLFLSALPSLLLLLFYALVPESPRYYCTKGRMSDALHILERVARANRATLPPGRLVLDRTEKDGPDAACAAPTDTAKSKEGGNTAIFQLLSPKLVFSTILLWVVFFGTGFSYYGLVLLASEFSNPNRGCTTSSRHSSLLNGSNLYENVFVTSLAEFPGLILSAATIDTLGRKLSMASMFFVSCICLLPMVSSLQETLIICLLFGARTCLSACFYIIFVYAPEVYPTTLRATGVGIASSMGRLGGIICPLVAVGLVESCHQTVAMILLELVMLVSGISVLMFPLETKGRDLNETVSTIST